MRLKLGHPDDPKLKVGEEIFPAWRNLLIAKGHFLAHSVHSIRRILSYTRYALHRDNDLIHCPYGNIADLEPIKVDTRSPRSSRVLRASHDVSGTRTQAWQAAP